MNADRKIRQYLNEARGAIGDTGHQMNADRILRRPEVEQLVGLKRSMIYNLMSLNEFPRNVKLTSGRAVGWRASAVQSWIESRAVSTRANPPTEARG